MLLSAQILAQIGWSLQLAETPFQPLSQGPDSQTFTLDGAAFTISGPDLFAAQFVITASSSQNIDFSTFTDLLEQATGFGHILSLFIVPIASVDTAAAVIYAPGTSNGLGWMLGGSTPTVTIPLGGVFLFSLPASSSGQVVDGTHKIVKLTNTSSTESLTVNVVAFGGS